MANLRHIRAFALFVTALSSLINTSMGEVVFDEPLVLLPAPPEEFRIFSQTIATDDGVQGKVIAMGRETPGCAVNITIETALDRSERAARVAAAKAYVNGCVQTFARAGMTLEKRTLPDLSKHNFDEPMNCRFEFAGVDGQRFYVFQQILFTDKGFNIQVMANNLDDFNQLKKWVSYIQIPVEQGQAQGSNPATNAD